MATKPATKPAPKTAPAPAPAAQTEEKPKLSRHQNFVRLANRRVKKALKIIEQIGNLSSSNYEYSEQEVDKLADVLTAALQKAIDRFHPKAAGSSKVAEPDLFTE